MKACGGVVALAALLFGAGCSSSGPKTTPDKFIGAWTLDRGSSINAMCFNLQPFDLTNQTLTLMKGTTSDLVSTLQTMMGTCTLNLTVNGTVATAEPNQTCTFMVGVLGNVVPVTVKITTWTVTTTDGLSMTTAATAVGSGGLADGCNVTVSGTGTKGAGDASAG